jgi:hypothetical protein
MGTQERIPPVTSQPLAVRVKNGAIADGIGIESAEAPVSADGWDSQPTAGRRSRVLGEHQR